MTNFIDDLQPDSLVVHEEKIYYVVYDDSKNQTTMQWHWRVAKALDRWFEDVTENKCECILCI